MPKIPLICPPQNSPFLDEGSNLLTRLWYLFFNQLAKSFFRELLWAVCGTGMALTDTYQNVADCELTLPTTGLWLVFGVFDFRNIGSAENGAYGQLLVGDVAQVGWANQGDNGSGLADGTRMMFWPVTVAAQTVVQIQAKTNVTGSGRLNPDSTKLAALFIKPAG